MTESENSQRGFSLVELVIILLIAGILSAVAAPKFFGSRAFEERGFHDELMGALRYAQKLAVAGGCEVQVQIVNNVGYTVTQRASSCTAGGFTRPVRNPGTGANTFAGNVPAGVALNSTMPYILFDALGSASGEANLTIGAGRQIRVVAETGFVCDPGSTSGCF